MTDINLKFVIALARTYNAIFGEIEKNIQSYGINGSEFGVLEMLYHKGDQPVQKVAEKILVTSGTITYVIDKLQKKDLVYRKNCKKDKRVFYICLTQKGQEFISEIFPKHKEFLDNLFKDISGAEKKEMIERFIIIQDKIETKREVTE